MPHSSWQARGPKGNRQLNKSLKFPSEPCLFCRLCSPLPAAVPVADSTPSRTAEKMSAAGTDGSLFVEPSGRYVSTSYISARESDLVDYGM